MKNRAFSVFSKRVIGCQPDQSALSSFTNFKLEYTNKNGSSEYLSELVLLDKEKIIFTGKIHKASILHRTILKRYNDIQQYFEKLESIQNPEELTLLLSEISNVFEVDYGLESILKDKILARFFGLDYVCSSLSALVDISIRLHSEKELYSLISGNLQKILMDDGFVRNPENIRLLQQVLSVNPSSSMLEELSTLPIANSIEKVDAVISIALSISESEDDFCDFFNNSTIDFENFDLSEFTLFTETLSRSPVKANFLTNDIFVTAFWNKLKEDVHYQLLFRCVFFVDEYNLEIISHVEIVNLFYRIFSSREKTFVNLYRDVRRSRRIVCSESEVRSLLDILDIQSLSINKLIFLFSLLAPYTTEKEKLYFLSKIMITKGLPVMNSEVSLTLSASIGLKFLSNSVINDALLSAQCVPCLPLRSEYDIIDVFDSVLTSPLSGKEVAIHDKVSVIITTYNPDLRFLKRAIRSIVLQSYQNIEVIVVDDCSDFDLSSQIENLCSEIASAEVKYFRNETNVGQYVSRNRAILNSSGSLIAIQDDDDVSHPQRLEKQVNAIFNSGCSVCFTNHVRYSDSGVLSIDDPQHGLVFGDGPATLLFRKDILTKIGGFRAFRSRGDIDFRTRIKNILGEGSIKNLGVPLYFMRSSLTTISSLYEYKHGDQLLYFRRKINMLARKKASVEECGNV